MLISSCKYSVSVLCQQSALFILLINALQGILSNIQYRFLGCVPLLLLSGNNTQPFTVRHMCPKSESGYSRSQSRSIAVGVTIGVRVNRKYPAQNDLKVVGR